MARFEAIPVGKLKALVETAYARNPAAFAWLADNRLYVGTTPLRDPELTIDLAEERLIESPALSIKGVSPVEPADISDTHRTTGHFIVRVKDKRWGCPSYKSALLTMLRELEAAVPGTLQRFSDELRRRSKKRWIVGKSKDDLYAKRALRDHSVPLNDEWWVGTNYSSAEIQKHLRAAARCAGLTWGRDASLDKLA